MLKDREPPSLYLYMWVTVCQLEDCWEGRGEQMRQDVWDLGHRRTGLFVLWSSPLPLSPSPSSGGGGGGLAPGDACFLLLRSWQFYTKLVWLFKKNSHFASLWIPSPALRISDSKVLSRPREWVLFEGVQTWTLTKYWKYNVIKVVDLVLVFPGL